MHHRAIEAELQRQAASKSMDKKEKAEHDARVSELGNLEKNYEDPGPVFDCVLWFDGKVPTSASASSLLTALTLEQNWNAVVDTKEHGDLTRALMPII